MNQKLKEKLIPVAVLAAICVVVGLLLAAINAVAAPIIEKRREEAIQASLEEVFPGIDSEEVELTDSTPASVSAIYRDKNGGGHVVTLSFSGYAGKINMTVGIDADGNVMKAVITDESETHSKDISSLLTSFEGKDAAGVLGVDVISGATYTSNYIKSALADALAAVGAGSSDTTVEITVAGYEGDITLSVSVDAVGAVTGVRVVSESESHGKDISPLIAALVGTNVNTVADVDVISGATYTSEYIKNGVVAALNQLGYTAEDNNAGSEDNDGRSESELLSLARTLLGADDTEACYFEEQGFVKKVYFSASKNLFAVYTVTSTQYVAVETEAFTVISHEGKVVDVMLLNWTVGHGVYPDLKYTDSYSGVDFDTVGEVELVSGATGTAEHLRTAVSEAIDAVISLLDEKSRMSIFCEKYLDGSELKPLDITEEGGTLLAVYQCKGGFIFETQTSTQYVANETHALVVVNNDLEIVHLELLNWTVGHGVYPDADYTDGYGGKTSATVGEVDLISGATGTSQNLRSAVAAGLEAIESYIADIAALVGGSVVIVTPSDAPQSVVAVYEGADGYVVETVTSTQYVAVETRALTVIDKSGLVQSVELVSWVVGHGVYPDDNYTSAYVGTTAETVTGVELVSGATGTAEHLRTAVSEAISTVEALIYN